jgi:hypothetical protein
MQVASLSCLEVSACICVAQGQQYAQDVFRHVHAATAGLLLLEQSAA